MKSLDDFPLISIITPSYNQGAFLGDTLESVLTQDYPRLEYIVVDGGSNDDSLEIILRYQSRIDYWVSEKDSGQSAAINKGLARSTGDIVGWLNSDDLLYPGALRKVAAAFSKNEHADVVHGKTMLFRGNREILAKGSDSSSLPHSYFAGMAFPQPSAFFRRKVYEQIGPLEEDFHYGMDYDFFLRAALQFDFVESDEIFSSYRLHSSSKTCSAPDKFAAEWATVFSKFLNSISASNDVIRSLADLSLYKDTAGKYTSTKRFSEEFIKKVFYQFLYNQLIFMNEANNTSGMRPIIEYIRFSNRDFFHRKNLRSLERQSNPIFRSIFAVSNKLRRLWSSFQ